MSDEGAADLRQDCPVCGRSGLAVLRFDDGTPTLVKFKCPNGCAASASALAATELADLLPELGQAQSD